MDLSLINQSRAHKSSGFTLIEVLIALFIFAILGVMITVGLRSVISIYERINLNNKRWQQLTMCVSLLQNDAAQVVARSVLNVRGDRLPPFTGLPNGDIEFSTMGFLNPLSLQKDSDLQRVWYIFRNHKLYRLIWPWIDPAGNTQPISRMVLDGVEDWSVQFIYDDNKKSGAWPPGVTLSAADAVPKMMVVSIKTKDFGDLKLMLAIPAGQ